MKFYDKLFKPDYSKDKVKKYLSGHDIFDEQRLLANAEGIIKKYGESLTANQGNVVFRISTL